MSIIDIDDLMVAAVCYRPIPWPEFVRELLTSYEPPLRAIATQRGMKHALEQVTALTIAGPDGACMPMVQSTADLKAPVIGELLKTRPPGLSPFTVATLLRYVRCACNAAVDAGYLRVSPFQRLKIGRLVQTGKPQGRRHLSREEIRQLLDRLAAEAEVAQGGWRILKAKRLQAVVATVAYTGLRRSEALRLHVDDVDLTARIIRVQPHADHRLKTVRSAGEVPVPAALVPILESYLPWRLAAPPGFRIPASVPWMFPNLRRSGPWEHGPTGGKPLDQLKAVAERAGIGRDASFQQLRRSLSTHLRTAWGASREQTAAILRHGPAVDDEFYLERDRANLLQAVKDVEF